MSAAIGVACAVPSASIFIGCAIASYLIGSIPTGFLWAKARGIDIRKVGSGNIGATNVMRTLGKGPGITVLAIDTAKGFLPVFLLPRVWMPALVSESGNGPAVVLVELIAVQIRIFVALQIICCVSVIAGHNWTCWLKFKGGKGVATSAGAMLAFLPFPLMCALAVWLIVFLLSRYVSLASICAAVTLPIATWFGYRDVTLLLFATLIAAAAIYKHRSNIQRLLAGTENRVGKPKSASGGGTVA